MSNEDWLEVFAGIITMFLCSLLDTTGVTQSPYGVIGGGIGASIAIFYRHLKP